jgi:cytochrome c peroxidase
MESRQAFEPRARAMLLGAVALGCALALMVAESERLAAHIIPPEKLHPVAESYRRLTFLLNLNPVLWPEVRNDAETIARNFAALAPAEAAGYRREVAARIDGFAAPAKEGQERPGAAERQQAAREVFELSTRAVARILELQLAAAERSLHDYGRASRAFHQARQIWASFEPEVQATDPTAFQRLGQGWLELAGSLGAPGVLQVGYQPARKEAFRAETAAIVSYVMANFGEAFRAPEQGKLAALPLRSPAFDPAATVPPRLPPGSEINKQLPRPRQVLNMTARGVDESETPLIALGDMAFDSPYIFGEPARSLGLSCNTCHNKSITNPKFFIPGLSVRPGGMDVSNSFFAPHSNNGHFDPLDIPDLRGIRFTAPYGRNGRFASLREFVRNVIVNEFAGPEPDPLLLDGMVAYMNEFDFLPNPMLNPDGSLNAKAPAAARRGEIIFKAPFHGLGGRSCATCHVPSDQFLDRKRHDIGSLAGSASYSRDRALDTPTLLSAKYTAPYFHNGSLPTLRAVSEWFNRNSRLGLTPQQVSDLTAYLETVGEGTDAMENTVYTLGAELEEFSFFLSAYEHLKSTRKTELMQTTFQTIAFEVRAHKWDVQDQKYLPLLDRLAELMDQAYLAAQRGDWAAADARVAEYRKLYRENKDHLK